MNFQAVLEKKIKPIFKPPEDHLNCDPCLELEEMIVETRPLHKKKKRLAKQRSAQRDSDPETALIKEFIVYNRFKELKRKAMEQKESDWQRELELAMANSIVNSLAPIQEKPTTSLATMESATATALNACVRCTNSQKKQQQPKDSDSIEFIDRTPSPQAAVTPTPRRFCCKASNSAREWTMIALRYNIYHKPQAQSTTREETYTKYQFHRFHKYIRTTMTCLNNYSIDRQIT